MEILGEPSLGHSESREMQERTYRWAEETHTGEFLMTNKRLYFFLLE